MSIADRSSPHRHWLTWAALFCVGAGVSWHVELLPDRVNELLAERFAFGLLALLVALWLGVAREHEARVRASIPAPPVPSGLGADAAGDAHPAPSTGRG